MRTLYLASNSPRRREILESLGFKIIRLSAEINETPAVNELAQDYVKRMAREKNSAALENWHRNHQSKPGFPVLAADTVVALAEQILGKPKNAAEAFAMLKSLSAKTHQVLTAVVIYWQAKQQIVLQESNVTFKHLSDREINAYIASKEPLDKAGAYGIQGIGGVFVSHLQGSFTGVMGLPVYESMSLLNACGYPTPPFSIETI